MLYASILQRASFTWAVEFLDSKVSPNFCLMAPKVDSTLEGTEKEETQAAEGSSGNGGVGLNQIRFHDFFPGCSTILGFLGSK